MFLLLCIAGALAAAAAAFLILQRRAASAPAGQSAASDDRARASRAGQAAPRQALRAASGQAGDGGRPGVGLQGNLAQIPLHDLLQFLALGRKSGVLELASGRRTGRILLSDGRIVRCEYRGKQGMEAAFLMLDLAEGDFELLEPAAGSGEGAPAQAAPQGAEALEAVDAIMLWMARKPKKKPA
jgi:hypothetical protein